MAKALSTELAAEDYGPAVSALNERQRAFAIALFKPRPSSTTRVADSYLEAGYDCADRQIAYSAGNRLMNTPALQAAIRELTGAAAISLAPKAVAALSEILDDIGHKDRAKVAKDIAERAAPTVQQIDVNHTHKIETQADRDKDIAAYVKKLRDMGVTRDKIADEVGYSALPRYERMLAIDDKIEDADFVEVEPEVTPSRAGLEDLLGD